MDGPASSNTTLNFPPPPLNHQHHPQLTEDQTPVCRLFVRGGCHRTNCRFLHKITSQAIKENFNFCHDYQNNTCERVNCKFLHWTLDEEEEFHRTGVIPSLRSDSNPPPVRFPPPMININYPPPPGGANMIPNTQFPPPAVQRGNEMVNSSYYYNQQADRESWGPSEPKMARYSPDSAPPCPPDPPVQCKVVVERCLHNEAIERRLAAMEENVLLVLSKISQLENRHNQFENAGEYVVDGVSGFSTQGTLITSTPTISKCLISPEVLQTVTATVPVTVGVASMASLQASSPIVSISNPQAVLIGSAASTLTLQQMSTSRSPRQLTLAPQPLTNTAIGTITVTTSQPQQINMAQPGLVNTVRTTSCPQQLITTHTCRQYLPATSCQQQILETDSGQQIMVPSSGQQQVIVVSSGHQQVMAASCNPQLLNNTQDRLITVASERHPLLANSTEGQRLLNGDTQLIVTNPERQQLVAVDHIIAGNSQQRLMSTTPTQQIISSGQQPLMSQSSGQQLIAVSSAQQLIGSNSTQQIITTNNPQTMTIAVSGNNPQLVGQQLVLTPQASQQLMGGTSQGVVISNSQQVPIMSYSIVSQSMLRR